MKACLQMVKGRAIPAFAIRDHALTQKSCKQSRDFRLIGIDKSCITNFIVFMPDISFLSEILTDFMIF